MAEQLRVLVVESTAHASDVAVAELVQAGHAVVRCSEPGEPSFPCAALVEGKQCPLRSQPPVDVVLDVRKHPRSQPAPGESGVSCAIQRHVPVVVAGSATLNPFEPWSTETLGRTYDVVDACVRAASQPLRQHSAVASSAVRDFLDRHDLRHLAARVAVVRRHAALEVQVHTTDVLPHDVKSMLSVRIIAALRALDPDAPGIDVTFV